MIRKSTSDFLKRTVDLGLTALALPMVLPFLVLLALAVRVESPGPAVFRQQRIGRRGQPFVLYKLRSMVLDAETLGAGLYAEKNDPRFTRVGLFLRRFSLDELPQLWNVLRGDMSIVGPRPMLEVTVAEYQDAYRTILRVKPGITGLSQVSGRNELSRQRRLTLDMAYALEHSLTQDLRIMVKTVGVAIGGHGQRNDQGRMEVENNG